MSTLSQFSGGGIKSIQRGTISSPISSLVSATATITAVNTAKTMLNFCGCQSGKCTFANAPGSILGTITLTSSTQITLTINANFPTNVSAATVSYEVIEYF